jgi:hypothetical protein
MQSKKFISKTHSVVLIGSGKPSEIRSVSMLINLFFVLAGRLVKAYAFGGFLESCQRKGNLEQTDNLDMPF